MKAVSLRIFLIVPSKFVGGSHFKNTEQNQISESKAETKPYPAVSEPW